MKFCPICGTPLSNAEAAPVAPAVPVIPAAPPAPTTPPMTPPPYVPTTPPTASAGAAPGNEAPKNNVTDVINGLNTADTTADYDADDIKNNTVMGVLAYLGILVLIPAFAAKESRFARFHANQGLILFIAEVIYGVARWVVQKLFGIIFGGWAGWICSLLNVALGLIGVVFTIFMILSAEIKAAAPGR